MGPRKAVNEKAEAARAVSRRETRTSNRRPMRGKGTGKGTDPPPRLPAASRDMLELPEPPRLIMLALLWLQRKADAKSEKAAADAKAKEDAAWAGAANPVHKRDMKREEQVGASCL